MSGIELAVSGSSLGGNMWMVDGANNNDVGSNRTILVFPSVDAIDEFKVHRNSYGAEFGGAAGAQVNIVTRSGTNQFHGSGYYFGRSDALAAKDYFLEQADQPKAPLNVNDVGGTIGGPIVKDKMQFFFSEEWNKETRGLTRAAFVPTAAERNGDFSAGTIEGCSGMPVDPTTGEAFPGNTIPANQLSPAGLLVMKLYPLPNVTPQNGSCNNWVTAVTTPINWRQENARVDYTFSNTARMLVRYTQDSWTNDSPSAEENAVGRRCVSGRGFELEAAGPIADGPVEPEHRQADGERADVRVLGEPDHRHARRPDAGSERPDQRRDSRHLPGLGEGVRRRPRPPDLLRPRQLQRRPAEHGAVLEQPEPVRVQGRLLGVVREALPESRRRLQLQPEERRRLRPGLRRVVPVRQRGRPDRQRRHHRQRDRRPAAHRHGVRLQRGQGRTVDPAAVEGLRALRLRLVEDDAARDARLRSPLVALREPVRSRRHDLELRSVDVQAGAGSRRVQRHAGAAGIVGLPGGRARGRHAGAQPRARESEEQLLPAENRRRVGRLRRRQDGRARWRRTVLPARVAAERAEPRVQPAVQPRARRQPHARQQRRAVRRRVRVRPTASRSTASIPPAAWATTGSGTSRSSARSRRTRRSRSATSAARAATCSCRTTSTRSRPATGSPTSRPGPTPTRWRRSGRTASSATRTSRSSITAGTRCTTRCRRSS